MADTTALATALTNAVGNTSILSSLVGNGLTYEAGVYTATTKEYASYALAGGTVLDTNGCFSSTYAAADLTLRYFADTDNDGKFEINNFTDLTSVGLTENNNEYATLDYEVTRSFNAKSQVLTTMDWGGSVAFTGSIDGQGFVISNFVIKGTTNVGLFKTLQGTIENLTLAQVMVASYETSSNVSMGVVATTNSGEVDTVSVQGEFFAKTSGTVTVGGISATGAGTVTSALGFMETARESATINATTNIAIVYRNYTNYTYKILVGVASGNGSTFASLDNGIKALANSYIIAVSPLQVNAYVPVVNIFRQWYAWKIICPWLTPSAHTSRTYGYIV